MNGRIPILASRSLPMGSGISATRVATRQRIIAAPGFPNAARTYATYEGNPHPTGGRMSERRRAFLPRFLLYSTAAATLFYGVSTVVAFNNQAYQDWFSDSVPFGEDILDYLHTHDVVTEARRLDYGGMGSQAVDSIGSTYHRVAEAASRVVSEVQDVSSDAAKKAKDAEKEAKNKFLEVRDQARKKVARVVPAGGVKEIKEEIQEGTENAKEEAKAAIEKLKEKSDSLIQKANTAAHDVEKEVKQRAKDARDQVESRLDKLKVGPHAASSSASTSGPAKPYDRPLPIAHEAPQGYYAAGGDRKLKAEQNDAVRLRADPQAPQLPQLRPALSSLTGSEPMIGQLAGTIDDLATFLKDTPHAGANARYVLDEAKEELQRLSKRLDEIRKTEQSRAEQTLSSQARRYEKELKQKSEEESKRFSELDAEGKRKVAEERQKASSEYESRLRTELDTQKEIINERLKEEVVAQGVEMQRRWMTEIKKRVEEERGGRLARLDELASELAEVQKVTFSNSTALEEGSGAHRTAAAVRALHKAAVSELREDEEAGHKRSFRREVNLLRSSPLAQDSEIMQRALEVLDVDGTPDEGVETLGSLTSWYISKVKPRLQSVALLPEQAGLLSHITSAILSPLLFTKQGNPQGADVPSILARAEYALLQKGDLEAATREINSLKGWGKVLAEDWLRESRRRLEVQQGVEILQAEADYNSLLNV